MPEVSRCFYTHDTRSFTQIDRWSFQNTESTSKMLLGEAGAKVSNGTDLYIVVDVALCMSRKW